jgi:hypothetical protein
MLDLSKEGRRYVIGDYGNSKVQSILRRGYSLVHWCYGSEEQMG